jgi:hypothetical protein
MRQEIGFDDACSLMDAALQGAARHDLVADISKTKDFSKALLRLRETMRAHVVRAGARTLALDPFVTRYDHRTRQDGFHALNDWDGKADHVNEEIIPVDVLDYLVERRGAEPADPRALAMLLDYYFFHILSLLALRVWDEGDADANLDRLQHLLDALQGPDGSGQRFVANAETLILIATSHFEVVERGYGKLLSRVKTLSRGHQTKVALGHAASMGSHLRFGFEATYGRDTMSMRNDNVADYPWLCFALVTVMREHSRLRDEGVEGAARDAIVEALLNGLSADARAFVGQPPKILSSCDADRAEFRDRFVSLRAELAGEFERYRPSADRYSPLSFFFNFSHNVLKGTIVDALLRGSPWDLTFNDLLTALPREQSGEAKATLARTLMTYARENPDRIGGRLMPVIVYDPRVGRRAFAVTMQKLAPSP